jgi:hypothetical protein
MKLDRRDARYTCRGSSGLKEKIWGYPRVYRPSLFAFCRRLRRDRRLLVRQASGFIRFRAARVHSTLFVNPTLHIPSFVDDGSERAVPENWAHFAKTIAALFAEGLCSINDMQCLLSNRQRPRICFILFHTCSSSRSRSAIRSCRTSQTEKDTAASEQVRDHVALDGSCN